MGKRDSLYSRMAAAVKIGGACALILSAFGCVGTTAVRRTHTFSRPDTTNSPPYRLGPGDLVRAYFRVADESPESVYRIQCGDELTISFYSNPELDQSVTVQSDSMVLLPPLGRMPAAGKTPGELQSDIESAFSSVVQQPLVFVRTVRTHQSSRQLVSVVTQDKGDLSILVGPDGCVTLPYADSAMVAGATIDEAGKVIAAKYRAAFPGLSVFTVLEKATNNAVFVFGEVKQPGSLALEATPTLTSALARTQVNMDVAGLRSVLVMSRGDQGETVGRIVDVSRILSRGDIGMDIRLRQYDVIFVPKKPIAVLDLFVKQYINDLIPQIFRIGIGWNLDLAGIGQ